MKRSSQHGIALVITLLMLSVVTLMAVVFLAISRRERASVTAVTDMADAQLMADAGLARAQAEIVSRIQAATNLGALEMLVSTNFISPAGFIAPPENARGIPNPTNVSYTYATGERLRRVDRVQNIGNLLFDPRPPVFIRTTNFSRAIPAADDFDFRFYLDLNRNRFFEDTGLVRTDARKESTNVTEVVGDPQWVGLLEHPDRPHSETNRFVGRFAYLTLPAGKSLDINFIHNYAKRRAADMSTDGYSRYQGVGSWELNLAAFLRDLNTNLWNAASYSYDPRINVSSAGRAFNDATDILRYRYNNAYGNLPSLQNYFGLLPANNPFLRDQINTYSDTPRATTEVDPVTLPWSGSDSVNVYFDDQDFFNPFAFPTNIARDLVLASRRNDIYNRYTYYRLLSQMGVDSRPAESNLLFQADLQLHPTNKFHLLFQPATGELAARGRLWDPTRTWDPEDPEGRADPALFRANATNFFMQVADRVLRAHLTTNITVNSFGRPIATNFVLGDVAVRPTFSVTDIQVFHPALANQPFWSTNVEYSGTVHRLLQVAANIYDATTRRRLGTTNDYPSVFRPIFTRRANGAIAITGYAEVSDLRPLQNRWRDLALPADRAALLPNDNVFGVPWVIGVKRGYPNFNELSVETQIQISRKLEIRKIAARTFVTNQMYVVGISNTFGVEAWNSYTQAFNRPIELVVTNTYQFALSNVVGTATNLLWSRRGVIARALATNAWAGSSNLLASPESFVVPIHTDFQFLTNSAYITSRRPHLFDPRLQDNFEPSFEPPRLFLYLTNRLTYWVIDKSVTPNRIIDFVNLDRLVSGIDILESVRGARSQSRDLFSDAQMAEGSLWDMTRIGAQPNAPTVGVVNQVLVALGDQQVPDSMWRSHAQNVDPAQREAEIVGFRRFMRGGDTNVLRQVPFTPTRIIYQRRAWQANDPLVHYTVADLGEVIFNGQAQTSANWDQVSRPREFPRVPANVGELNYRYRPWGGYPKADPLAGLNSTNALSVVHKDPLVVRSDDWRFPTNKLASIGWLGRIHRGTPWQTIFLKSDIEPATGRRVEPLTWAKWSGSFGTHPTNDWKLLDLFTVAPNANASRGLLAVNQSGAAAWSAALSGLPIVTNSVATGNRLDPAYIQPASAPLMAVINGINRTRNSMPNRLFPGLGDVLATPELTTRSPYLSDQSNPIRLSPVLTDAVVEQIPQLVLSLLKSDEARFVVYAFGQSLKPAERSIVTSGRFYNICTNYQITGEVALKAVLRVDDAPRRPRVVVESFNLLSPD